MKIVINIALAFIFLFSLIYSCGESNQSTPIDNNGCFIINGCESTDFDLERIFVRTSYKIEGDTTIYKSSIFQSNEIKKGIIITTENTYSLCGSVKYEDSPVLASLGFIQKHNDPLIPSITADTDENGDFCATLNEGDYTILISPYKQESIPQLRVDVKIDKDISNLKINYPTGDKIRYIYGNVILDSKSNLPVEGINVLAYKKYEDGINLQSNISTTDSDGYFSLIIPTMSDNFSLMLYGSSKNPDWPIIKFEDIITDGIIQLGSINLGFVPKSTHITGTISTFEKSQIIATMKSDSFSYSKSFYTDNNGYFEADLREGEYSFLILPEDIHLSKWSISSHSNISVPQMTEYNINLEPKVKLEGKILFDKKGGTPRVKFVRSGGCDNNSIDNITLENSIIADSEGNFEIYLSKGKYRIFINTEDNNKANIISDSLCITDNNNLGEIVQPASCLFTGEIKNQSGIKITNVNTEVFLLDKKSNEHIKIGESTSESNKFSVRIPAYFCK